MAMNHFRVRLNCIDHYQALPISDFDPPVPLSISRDDVKDRPRVSVIRVFGATETGQKVLMHVHGAFQYTYIEYSGSLLPEDVSIAARTLQLSIDHALAVSYRKKIYEGRHNYVAHISLVKGIPFYGYHVGYKCYLKVCLLNPSHMTRLADLLREGAILKRVLQPYESHMQYLAQWMCDYNLYGCAYLGCSKVKFRGPVPDYLEIDNIDHHWHDHSIPAECISDGNLAPRQSHCPLEVDVCVQDIVSRDGIEARHIHHDFVERVNPLSLDAKLVQSMAGLWKDETRRRKARMGLTDPNSSPFPPEVLITMSADPRNVSAGGWIHERDYREQVSQLAAEEHTKSDARDITFDSFVTPAAHEGTVKTTLESVEDLYPQNLDAEAAVDQDKLNAMAHDYLIKTQAFVDEGRVHEVTQDHQSDIDELPVVRHRPHDQKQENDYSSGAQNHSSADSKEDIFPPIRSFEFEELGIRKAGDLSHTDEDAFVVPVEHSGLRKDVSTTRKRLRLAIDKEVKPRKRRHFLVDEEETLSSTPSDAESGIHGTINNPIEDNAERVSRSSLAKSTARPHANGTTPQTVLRHDISGGSQDLKHRHSPQSHPLPFAVVKDSHDPNTMARLSQQSSSSQKLSEASPSKAAKVPVASKHAPLKIVPSASPRSLKSARTTISSASAIESSLLKHVPQPAVGNRMLTLSFRAPGKAQVETTSKQADLPHVIYQDAFYSKEEDVPDREREYAGREFRLESITVPYLPDFDAHGTSAATYGQKQAVLIDQVVEDAADTKRRRLCKLPHWTVANVPPRRVEVVRWCENLFTQVAEKNAVSRSRNTRTQVVSQIQNATQKNKHGFKYSQKKESASVSHETQYMSAMSLEVHVNTRGSLAPNPEEDEIACVFWCVQTDHEDVETEGQKPGTRSGILALAHENGMAKRIAGNIAADVEDEKTELDLLTRMVDIVRHHDPDILTGYEVHNSSWGYLIERARLKHDLHLCDEFSRMRSQSHGRFGKENDRWGFNHTSTIRVTGRHTINIWRAMRGELNLLQYTMENVAFHLLHKRMPHYAFADLTKWYRSKNPRHLSKVVEYFISRVQTDLEILDANELVARTSEQARLLGVDWFSVISRGSQFKVESLMFRIAKPENFVLISPSRRQVGGQNALECLPLVMEPQSDFYTSPLLVLDFQSLYPSVMIAYNYCYSTFLGRVVNWRGTNKMGFTNYQREDRLIELLKDHINIAPNGIMYAKSQVRKSLLAKMLSEILETRVMVKSGMKVDKDDKTLQRLLNNRQLALKLIANVTYGYTSASFSGRMPCSEIADSIVQTGRETLEKTIALIHSVEKWGAEVVYGDTDSLFVYLKGRTREQAFDIGEDIAATITRLNPRPVKLKFEKVYHPCVLLAKKRYVGFKYESRGQTVPDFDAKGIETVRRDGTPAEQKIEENALKILFRTSDLSQVKGFFQAQCAKIMQGRVSIQDFCFAKEVRLGTYSEKGPPPPGALISARRMLEDPRLEPQYGERIPYVVITGEPGARLIDRCVAPEVLLDDAQLELDAEYYISKNLIPPLERIFNLVGANVRQWYDEMPKYQRIRHVENGITVEGKDLGLSRKTLESYMKSSTCMVCREALDTESPLCNDCFEQAPHSLLTLRAKLIKAEKQARQLAKVCRSCSGLGWNDEIKCDSKDCPVFYTRTRHNADLLNTEAQTLPIVHLLEEQEDGLDW